MTDDEANTRNRLMWAATAVVVEFMILMQFGGLAIQVLGGLGILSTLPLFCIAWYRPELHGRLAKGLFALLLAMCIPQLLLRDIWPGYAGAAVFLCIQGVNALSVGLIARKSSLKKSRISS